MGLSICPAAVVAPPVAVVWEILVQWEHYSEWADAHPERIEPEGPATVGQTISFAGKALSHTWRFSFKVEEINKENNYGNQISNEIETRTGLLYRLVENHRCASPHPLSFSAHL